ncbi:MAG: phosphodiester glycosidase family protein [Candidatus Melainabacteria bacterium]|nr:phosphodiester glycosidase family protein [Candidatus Melainabacteria bacterium]
MQTQTTWFRLRNVTLLRNAPHSQQLDRWKALLSLLVLLCCTGVGGLNPANACPKHAPSLDKSPLLVETQALASANLVWITLHTAQATLRPVWLADDQRLKTTGQMAQTLLEKKMAPLLLINAGYFDPNNGQTTAHLMTEGQWRLDPKNNPRLTENESLQPFLAQIYNRSEFRVYGCKTNRPGATETRYDIARHQDAVPSGCELQAAVGAGPMLLPTLTDAAEAFTHQVNGRLVRDPIGVGKPNARSAIGLLPNGDILLVLVSQATANGAQPAKPGLSLPALQALLKQRGVIKALNLDGGGSSSLWIQETKTQPSETLYAKRNAKGLPEQRPLKSWLGVFERPTTTTVSPSQSAPKGQTSPP